jgi:hypothetical protein
MFATFSSGGGIPRSQFLEKVVMTGAASAAPGKAAQLAAPHAYGSTRVNTASAAIGGAMPVEASAGVDAAASIISATANIDAPASVDAGSVIPVIPRSVIPGSVIPGSVISRSVIPGSVIPAASDVTAPPGVNTTGAIIPAAADYGTAMIGAAGTSDGCPSDGAIGDVRGGRAFVNDRTLRR